MRFSRFALLAALVVTAGVSRAQDKSKGQDHVPGPEAAARASAEAWLALIDSAKYAESYDAAAEEIKTKVTREQWVSNFAGVRKASGSLQARQLISAFYTESIPNAPAGHYVVLQFQARFSSGSSTEQVVAIQEKDGSWREVGYVMSPPQ